MAQFNENNQWVDLPLEAIYNLFQVQPGGFMEPRTAPITLVDGTEITKEVADRELLVIAIQNVLDTAAKAKGYDNIHSAALRAAFDGPFKAEGIKFAIWMDSVWLFAYQLLDEVKSGAKPLPTKEELIAELPVLAS
jgi:hypothetical protein